MDFAEIRYMKSEDELWLGPFVKKLPEKLYIKYLMLLAPLKVEKIEFLESNGVVITFPILKNGGNADLELRLIKKAAAMLIEKNIDIVINRDDIPFMQGFKEVKGGVAMSFFMNRIINIAANEKGINMAEAEVIVIDGDNLQTYAVLNAVKEEVNRLWIQTIKKDKLRNAIDAIYEDSGLAAECFESVRNPIMGRGDIIINCRGDMENFDYTFKRGACYIDVSGFKGKLYRLMERRMDMYIINNCIFKIGESFTDACGTEAYFILKIREFERAFENEEISCDVEKVASFLTNGDVVAYKVERIAI